MTDIKAIPNLNICFSDPSGHILLKSKKKGVVKCFDVAEVKKRVWSSVGNKRSLDRAHAHKCLPT